MKTVKRTERGWPGHFFRSHLCLFRRNTLLECDENQIVVSTIGTLIIDGKVEEIGNKLWYETAIFWAKEINGYVESDVNRQINSTVNWRITADSLEYLVNPDNMANDMHEENVKHIEKMLLENRLVKDWS